MQTYSTAHESRTDEKQRQKEIQPRNQALQEAQTASTQMTSQSYFNDMRQFLYNCRHDKRLTPATQLVYRTLVAMYNVNYWAARFIISDAELKEITHITSNEDITRIKRNLKNLGYIDFKGKPTQYIINSPPVYKPVQQPVHRQHHFNEPTIKRIIPKEEINKEERVRKHDNDDSDKDWRTSKEVAQLLKNH